MSDTLHTCVSKSTEKVEDMTPNTYFDKRGNKVLMRENAEHKYFMNHVFIQYKVDVLMNAIKADSEGLCFWG